MFMNMSDEKKKKYWFCLTAAAMLPGFLLWVLLCMVGFAGEYAGLIMGLVGIRVFRWTGAELKKTRLFIGAAMLVFFCFAANHFSYCFDVMRDFSEVIDAEIGGKFSFFEASSTVIKRFLIENVGSMRGIYLEAAIQGLLLALLFWVALFIYYIKFDEIEEEQRLERIKREEEKENERRKQFRK